MTPDIKAPLPHWYSVAFEIENLPVEALDLDHGVPAQVLGTLLERHHRGNERPVAGLLVCPADAARLLVALVNAKAPLDRRMRTVSEVKIDALVELGLCFGGIQGIGDRPHVLGITRTRLRRHQDSKRNDCRRQRQCEVMRFKTGQPRGGARRRAEGFATASSKGIRSPPGVRAGRCRLRS